MRRHVTSSAVLAALLLSKAALAQAPAARPQTQPPPPATKPAGDPKDPFAIPDPRSTLSPELEEKLRKALGGTAGGLTSDQVAKRAAQTAPSVRDRERQVESADARIDSTKAGFYPRLIGTARASYLSPITLPPLAPGSLVVSQDTTQGPVAPGEQLYRGGTFSFPVILDQYEFKATLNVPLSDYLLTMSSALGAASKNKRSAELNAEAEKLLVATQARLAFYEYARAVGQSLVAEQSYGELVARRDDAKRGFEVGLSSKADFLRAESGVEQGSYQVTRSKNQVFLASEQLRTQLHDEPGTEYTVGENILAPMTPLPDTDNLASLQQEAFKQRLEIRALDETVYALKDQAHVQRMGNIPRIDGQANATYANPNQRFIPQQSRFDGTWDINAVLTWSPTDILVNSAKARDTDAQAASVNEKRMALLDNLRVEVTQAWTFARDAAAQREAAMKALAASAESFRVRTDLYRAGRATLVELTDAQTNLTRARIDVVDAQINERQARARILRAVGRDIPPATKESAARDSSRD